MATGPEFNQMKAPEHHLPFPAASGDPYPVIHGASNFRDVPPRPRQLASEGLRVTMDAIPGLTATGLLDGPVPFQCPPMDEFAVTYAHSHNDYETLNQQQSRKGVPQLATVTFDTLVVDWAMFAVTDFGPDVVDTLTKQLKQIVQSGSPIFLTAEHRASEAQGGSWDPEIAFAATLRSLRVAERAGEGDARYLNVSFVQYRAPGIRAYRKRRPGQAVKLPSHAFLYADGHASDANGKRIASDCTLRDLARHYYKEPALYKHIAKANNLGGWGGSEKLIKHPRFKKMKKQQREKLKIGKKPGDDGSGANQSGALVAPGAGVLGLNH